jgi:hypothetical protein
MPRKQRFKPSRKPKPMPPSEDAVMGVPAESATVHDHSGVTSEMSPQAAEDATFEHESDVRSG